MKKILTSVFLLLLSGDIFSCNLCWDYPKGKRLRQIPIQKNINCSCECWKYSKTKGDNNFYICTECRHRITPEEVFIPKGQKGTRYEYKRWKQAPAKKNRSA